ncbi:hypothetical protein [Rubrobacter marinus]|uniref:hypothetical protein n=1 Tax=Rubrobacter marinus TaxID=2653852 RepID=UPI00140DE591|nr:hypothetical protein [Rubrobacter marinus]
MTTATPGERPRATPFAAVPGLPLAILGLVGLAAVVGLLPLLGDEDVTFPEQILSYVLAIVPSGALVYGLLASLDARLRTPLLLLAGAAAGAGGALAAYLGGRPEDLGVPAALPLALLLLANALRIAAAVSLALALARQVTSLGAALLVAVAASASDLFSVFAGPTKALVREDAPILDFLLLIYPTFGYPLGFALGVADFVFLALFVALAGYLALKPLATLLLGCISVLAAMLTGLLLGTALPALPFVAVSFLAANASPLCRAFFTDRKPR